ncbi:methyltransferase domain-containing protein [Gallaecimonas sp. GXIMD4217]|uniref:class I SAM-dependent methyltransferase n=1 Tax=Gallaecimonas sp. GXIMD4217 TaxID=3131927 RepID=UPI00311AC6BE
MTSSEHPALPGAWSDHQADQYLRQWGQVPLHDRVAELAGIRAGDRVLDIGCGGGHLARLLAALGAQVTGVDPTPRMVEQARAQSQNLAQAPEFLEASAERLPLDDDGLDLALAVCSLHHWQDLAAGLAEVRRVLRPGGRLVIIEENWAELLPELGEQFPGASPEDFPVLDMARLACQLRDAGLAPGQPGDYRAPGIAVHLLTATKE